MRSLLPIGFVVVLTLGGCTPSVTPGEATATPRVSATSTPTQGTLTQVTPTPSDYPREAPEDSAVLVTSFGEQKLGSKNGDFLVYLTAKDNLDIEFVKRGNPAFATGANSTSPEFSGDVGSILKENAEFTEPLKRVLESYLQKSYAVKDGDQDPLAHSPEFEQKAKEVQDAL